MTRVSATAARRDFAETLNRVAYRGERVVLERNGKDIAVLISIEDLELLRKFEDAMDNAAADEANDEPGRSWDEIKSEMGL